MARTVGIIGSGIGSLAAGIRLLKKGYQVTIFESRNIAGGKAAGIEIEGHMLDSGPTIVRMPQLLIDLFNTCDSDYSEELQPRMMSTIYRIYQQEAIYLDITNHKEITTTNLAQFSSNDADNYAAFHQRTEKIYQENLTPPPIEKKGLNLFKKIQPKQVLPLQPSVFQETAHFFKVPFLQQAFSFHPLLFGRNPFQAHFRNLMLFAIEQQWGVMKLKGGFHRAIILLLRRFADFGGQLHTNTSIEEIILEENQAHVLRLSSGKKQHFDILISNLSPHATQQLIRPNKNPPSVSPQQSTSFFQLHLLCDGDSQTQSQPHTIITTNDYRQYVQTVFHQHQLPEDPWLYLHTKDRVEGGFLPLMIMTPVPNTANLPDWDSRIFSFRNTVIEKVESIFPGFQKKIHFERISTPITFEEEYQLPAGSPLFPPIRHGISNLYYVGDNTWSNLGLIAALSSAEQVANSIQAENATMV